jgi:opacity protein-like surface antigen
MTKYQYITGLALTAALFGGTVSAQAADPMGVAADSGFYGGISLRQNSTDTAGLAIGKTGLAWNRLAPVVADDMASRALVFGGYRWTNDIAVEAAMSSADKYALRPLGAPQLGQGVGLKFGPGTGSGTNDLALRSVNVDVFTSWTVYKTFALYGRMGYAQSDAVIAYSGLNTPVIDSRRNRDGMNYGLGVRYDLNSSLGLRLEYGRFGRLSGEVGNGLPESDQVSFGLQLRF